MRALERPQLEPSTSFDERRPGQSKVDPERRQAGPNARRSQAYKRRDRAPAVPDRVQSAAERFRTGGSTRDLCPGNKPLNRRAGLVLGAAEFQGVPLQPLTEVSGALPNSTTMRSHAYRNLVNIVILLALSALARGDEWPSPTYEKDIKPLFAKRCTVCHRASKRSMLDLSGGLALDSLEGILAGSAR